MGGAENQRKTVYFIHDGKMMSGWVIGRILFNAKVDPAANENRSELALVGDAVFGMESPRGVHDSGVVNVLISMTERPGEWLYLSGDRLVHRDDCFDSKEKAAENYKEKLLGE